MTDERSSVKIVGQFLDTVVFNVYPTNTRYEVERRDLSSDLKQELQHWKDSAQDEEEDIPTRFTFHGLPLFMKTKGSQGFNWILSNPKVSIAIKR
jgi:hypothetical protein